MKAISPFLLKLKSGILTIIVMTDVAKHIVFTGRVQGVGFRYTTHRLANRHDLSGFVRNLPDGTVEALLQGSEPNVRACVNEIKEYFISYLRDTQITDQPVNSQYHEFRITY